MVRLTGEEWLRVKQMAHTAACRTGTRIEVGDVVSALMHDVLKRTTHGR